MSNFCFFGCCLSGKGRNGNLSGGDERMLCSLSSLLLQAGRKRSFFFKFCLFVCLPAFSKFWYLFSYLGSVNFQFLWILRLFMLQVKHDWKICCCFLASSLVSKRLAIVFNLPLLTCNIKYFPSWFCTTVWAAEVLYWNQVVHPLFLIVVLLFVCGLFLTFF